MKSTTNFRALTQSAVAMIVATFAFVACSDYDNGFTEKQIAYERDFLAAFGEISPEQDWNVATRATVNVTTAQPSNVKIYAYDGVNYSIVGDYSNVIGSRTLGFDVAKGIEKILVTDGKTGQKTMVGGSVSFESYSTRTIYDEKDLVSSTGMYVEFPKEDAIAYTKRLPEIGKDKGGDNNPYEKTNLPKVTKNFKYISNGPFTIHPVFWFTDLKDEVGIYYTDDKGKYHEVPFYKIKETGDDASLQDLKWRYIVVDDFEATNWNDAIKEAQKKIENGGTLGKLVSEDEESYSDFDVSTIDWDEGSQRYYITSTNNGTNKRYIIKYYYRAGDTDEVTKVPCTHNYFRVYEIRDISNLQYTTSGYDEGWTDTQRSKEITISLPKDMEFGMYLKGGAYTYYSEASKNGRYGEKINGERFKNTPHENENACYAASIDINDEKYLCFEDWPDGDFDLNDVVLKFSGNMPELIDEDADPNATWDILCEDLGGSFDTDFNDVVLKVEHVSGRGVALVTPLAAGGTLASYTFFKTTNEEKEPIYTLGREIHQRFSGIGEAKSGEFVPIDVWDDETNYRANEGRQIEIDVPENWSLAYCRADNYGKGEIGEWGKGEDMNMGGFIIKVLPEGVDAPYHLDFNDERFGEASVIAAPNKGEAPQMICVPDQYYVVTSQLSEGETKYYRTTYKFAWSQELVSLSDSYADSKHSFREWVQSYSESENTYSKSLEWYKYPTGAIVKRTQIGDPVECDEEGNLGNYGKLIAEEVTQEYVRIDMEKVSDGVFNLICGENKLLGVSSVTFTCVAERIYAWYMDRNDQYKPMGHIEGEGSASITFTSEDLSTFYANGGIQIANDPNTPKDNFKLYWK